MAVDSSVFLSGGEGGERGGEERGGKAKIVFVMTSGDKTERAAEVAARVVDEREGVVVTLQNGLGNERVLERGVGEGKVLVGVTSQSAILSGVGLSFFFFFFFFFFFLFLSFLSFLSFLCPFSYQ